MTDLKFAFRQLLKYPGFTAVAVLTLALGIGANTAIFGFIDRLLLRPLPVDQPQELVTVVEQMEQGGVSSSFNYPLYLDYRDRNQVFSGLVAYSGVTVNLRATDSSELVKAMIVSGNYFSVLGVKAAQGRMFLPEEDQVPLTHPVTVISQALWHRHFTADPAMVGKTITLNGHPFTVIGVAPSDFRGTITGFVPDLYVPMMMQPWAMPVRDPAFAPLQSRGFTWLNLLGRLKPGVSREQAQGAMRVLAAQVAKVETLNTSTAVLLQDGHRGHGYGAEPARFPLLLLMAAVGLVLLMTCTNVANLLLARAVGRQREMAIRLAIGASRGRLIQQLLSESLLLACIGGACGLLLAFWLGQAAMAMFQGHLPFRLEAGLDTRVLLFALAVSVGTGVAFGLAPAWQASRPDLVPTLKEGAMPIAVFRRRWSLRGCLVVSQVAFSLLVLVCAGLCLRSLHKLQAIDLGFDAQQVLAVSVETDLADYSESRSRRFFADLQDRVTTLPGVEAVSLTLFTPLGGAGGKTDVVRMDDYEIPAGQRVNWDFSVVSPGYFRTLGIPLLRGRDFSQRDAPGAPKVIVVNEALAQRYWPNQDAIGKRIWLRSFDKDGPGQKMVEVIGVVRDGKFRELKEPLRLMMYWPLAQSPFSVADSHLLVRATDDPKAISGAVRGVVGSLDANLPVSQMRTLAEQKSWLLFPERSVALALGAFGVLGLLLAASGIYGVVAHVVSQRTREIGIRMALGAQRTEVLGLMLRQGAVLVAAGLVAGLGGALAATRLLASFLYGVGPGDPLTYMEVSLVLALAAFVSCWLPARRAAKLDPMVALRYE
jgi:predicted permease